MNRRDVLRKIQRAAEDAGLGFSQRELTRHTGITVGRTSTTMPRHREISDRMAEVIFRQVQDELGKGWWRK